MLVAVELLIAGVVIGLMRGEHLGLSAQAAGLHRIAFVPQTFAPIDAGAAPHVIIDDPDSRVVVAASSDNRVHVTDRTSAGGFIYGAAQLAALHVERTADGVRIARPSSGGFVNIGWIERRVEIAVPAAASLDILRSSGAQVSDLTGSVGVHSNDGSIVLQGLRGATDAKSDDGHIEAHDVRADRLTMASRDGRLVLDGVAVGSLVASTRDGSVRANDLRLSKANIHTDDGPVSLHFADAGNLNVRAHTSNGRIRVDGRSTHTDDDAVEGTYTLGNGAGALDVSTQDGTITMTTNGAQ